PVAVAVIAVHRAAELVGARLGHRVDVGARRTGDGHVVVGQVDVDRFDRLHRHRLATGGHDVAFEAKGVAGGDAVNADRVVARVLAGGADRARGAVYEGYARIQAHVVRGVAADRGQRFDGGAVDVGAGANLGRAEYFRAAGDADRGHRAECGHIAGQGCVDGV